MHLTDKNAGFEQKQITLLALSVPIRYSKPILKNKYTHTHQELLFSLKNLTLEDNNIKLNQNMGTQIFGDTVSYPSRTES